MNTLIFLLALAFNDHVDCTIQAKFYKLDQADVIDFKRADTCTGVRVTTDEKQIVLYSPNAWVVIPIESDKGWRRFQYRWGANVAHIEAGTVEVTWGYVVKS